MAREGPSTLVSPRVSALAVKDLEALVRHFGCHQVLGHLSGAALLS